MRPQGLRPHGTPWGLHFCKIESQLNNDNSWKIQLHFCSWFFTNLFVLVFFYIEVYAHLWTLKTLKNLNSGKTWNSKMKCDTVMADDDNTRQWKSIEMFINYLPYMYISVTTASRGVNKLSNIRSGYSVRLYWTGWIEIWSGYMISVEGEVRKLSNIRLYLIILQPRYINADICCFLTLFELKTRLECKYCWYVLREWISQRNIAPKAKFGIWHAIKSLFRTKRINNGMFIEDVTRWQQWRQYDIILITWYYICITWVLIKRKNLQTIGKYKTTTDQTKLLISFGWLIDWLIDWLMFNANISSITSISWGEQLW